MGLNCQSSGSMRSAVNWPITWFNRFRVVQVMMGRKVAREKIVSEIGLGTDWRYTRQNQDKLPTVLDG
jgi:hypothetical protein